jgi:hypothetical protein
MALDDAQQGRASLVATSVRERARDRGCKGELGRGRGSVPDQELNSAARKGSVVRDVVSSGGGAGERKACVACAWRASNVR